jgi:hypothetical protein
MVNFIIVVLKIYKVKMIYIFSSIYLIRFYRLPKVTRMPRLALNIHLALCICVLFGCVQEQDCVWLSFGHRQLRQGSETWALSKLTFRCRVKQGQFLSPPLQVMIYLHEIPILN